MINTIDAILAINPDAKVQVFEKDGVREIVWLENTPEISDDDIDTKILELEEQEELAKTAKEEKKASGKQKLKDLGLDDDEINALMGV